MCGSSRRLEKHWIRDRIPHAELRWGRQLAACPMLRPKPINNNVGTSTSQQCGEIPFKASIGLLIFPEIA